MVRLTHIGNQARETGQAYLESAEREWTSRYGSTCINKLREVLGDLVKQMGDKLRASDISMTGGRYIPAEAGPPRIPAHGHDWPVVLRASHSSVSQLPLTALISQTLTAFTIDYDQDAEQVLAALRSSDIG